MWSFWAAHAKCIWMRCHMTSHHDSTCGECLHSLSLFTFCLFVEHAGSLKRGQLKPGWNHALRQMSNVPNISRAFIWRQRKSVTCSAVCVPVHTTCDNQSFPILPEYAACHRQMVSCASDHESLAARVIKIMTLTRQRRVAHCRGHRDVTVCHYFFFHMV